MEKRFRKNRSGFTLIELMIVAVIVAILAAVLVPMMTGSRNRAYATEAEAALGTIRTALRVTFAENNAFPVLTNALVEGNVPGIEVDDLKGNYFSSENYTITSTATTYAITCNWAADDGDATNDATHQGVIRTIAATTILDQDGNWTRTGY